MFFHEYIFLIIQDSKTIEHIIYWKKSLKIKSKTPELWNYLSQVCLTYQNCKLKKPWLWSTNFSDIQAILDIQGYVFLDLLRLSWVSPIIQNVVSCKVIVFIPIASIGLLRLSPSLILL